MKTEAILEKVKSNHNNLSRSVYSGWLYDKPRIGEQFCMTTREEGGLYTTPIKTLRFVAENEVEFDTSNSIYRLTYINDIVDEVYIDPIQSDIMSVFVKYGVSSNLAVVAALKALTYKLIGRSNA